jgi:uncharacterized RDD family membrane protein YckC
MSWQGSYALPPLTAMPAVRPRYAGFWRRFFALFLDSIVSGVAIFGFVLVVSGTGLEVLQSLASLAYFALLDAGGGTLGKRVFSVRVIDVAGNAPGIVRGILRHPFGLAYALMDVGLFAIAAIGDLELAFGAALISILVLLGLGVGSVIDGLWMLGDPHRQTLHDKLAGTYVVEV